jgi:hypothetical protein
MASDITSFKQQAAELCVKNFYLDGSPESRDNQWRNDSARK